MPEPTRIIILRGRNEGISRLVFSKGGPEYNTILDLARCLAGDSTVMDPEAGAEVAVGCNGGEILPDLGGALLIFDPQVTVSVTSPLDLRLRTFRPDPWMEFHAREVTRLFIPCAAWGRGPLAGSFYLRGGGGWEAPEGHHPYGRRPEVQWAALHSPLATTLDPGWLDAALRRYLRPSDLRPGWPPPPRTVLGRVARTTPLPTLRPRKRPPGPDPIWQKPPARSLPPPSRVIVYLGGGERAELPWGDPRCARLRNALRVTLDSVEIGCCGTYEIPPGLSPQGGPDPDWPGVLVIFDPPAALVTRTTVDPWTAEYAVLPWKETRLEGIVRAYFPARIPDRKAPSGLVQDGAYFLSERELSSPCAPEWMIGAYWGLYHQRRLGLALEEVGREFGGW